MTNVIYLRGLAYCTRCQKIFKPEEQVKWITRKTNRIQIRCPLCHTMLRTKPRRQKYKVRYNMLKYNR